MVPTGSLPCVPKRNGLGEARAGGASEQPLGGNHRSIPTSMHSASFVRLMGDLDGGKQSNNGK